MHTSSNLVTDHAGSGLRSLHLVDLENLTGGPNAPRAAALAAFDHYLDVAGWIPGDHVLRASSARLMGRIAFDLDRVPASKHVADGPDGADLLLLSLAPEALVASRYQRLVIGSGDGIFGDRARAVRDRGVEVDVVAPRGGCSYRLWGFAPTLIDPADFVLAA